MLGWALNEEENVADYIEKAEQCLNMLTDDYEVIIIDDGSTDRTWEIAGAYQQTRPWLRLYKNERTRGPGFNAKRAIALAHKDYLFWQTVDWAYDIRQLIASLELLRKYDVLQGVRVDALSGGRWLTRRSDHPGKAIVSLVNYALIRLLFRLPLHDYQNVTVYPRRLIQAVKLETESAFINPECLLKVWWKGATIKEVPVPFLKRQKGVAKGTSPGAVAAAVKDVFYWWWQWIVLGKRDDKGRGRVVPWHAP